MKSIVATCPCGAKNRLPAAPRVRCGACKREFTAHEVMTAALGATVAGPEPTKTERAEMPMDYDGSEEQEEDQDDD